MKHTNAESTSSHTFRVGIFVPWIFMTHMDIGLTYWDFSWVVPLSVKLRFSSLLKVIKMNLTPPVSINKKLRIWIQHLGYKIILLSTDLEIYLSPIKLWENITKVFGWLPIGFQFKCWFRHTKGRIIIFSSPWLLIINEVSSSMLYHH